MTSIILLITAFVLSWALTGLLVRALAGGAHQALPNERSMHERPVPVGGGFAILLTLFVLVPLWQGLPPENVRLLLVGLVLLAAVSAIDQYTVVWPLTRLAAQLVAVALALTTLPDNMRLIADLPFWVERGGIALAWLWLINLTNFMDGIDGIAAAEAAAVAAGVVVVLSMRLARGQSLEATVAIVLAGACLGYLVWNWSPARIFMGDVGSIPIGFLMGWLLLDLAAAGAWTAALVLPLLFVADATVTLMRRILNGEKPWRAHRKHFYQRAVQGGARVPDVVGLLTACNVVLILLATQSTKRPVAVLAASIGIAILFLAVLAHKAAPFEKR